MRNPDLNKMDFHQTVSVWGEIGEWLWRFSGIIVVMLTPLFIFFGILAVVFDVSAFSRVTFALGVMAALNAIFYTLYLQLPLILSKHNDHEFN